MSTALWLARHGETTWNLAGRYQGRMESALSGLGMRQGMAFGRAFHDMLVAGEAIPTRIVSSPLLRCSATAQFAADQLGVPVKTDERLIEIAHGTWEGRYRDELSANDPDRYRAWRERPAEVAFEAGESLRDVLARWQSFARELHARTEPTLVVTHDAVVRCALVDARGLGLEAFWDVRVENAAFATFCRGTNGFALDEECATAHLAGLRADVTAQAL